MVKISRVEMKGIMENIMSYKGSESQDKTRRKDIWHQQRKKKDAPWMAGQYTNMKNGGIHNLYFLQKCTHSYYHIVIHIYTAYMCTHNRTLSMCMCTPVHHSLSKGYRMLKIDDIFLFEVAKFKAKKIISGI